MKKTFLITLTTLILSTATAMLFIGCSPNQAEPAVETTELNSTSYKLLWKEDFNNADCIDKNWFVLEEDFGESQAGNGYHIYASRSNLSVSDGIVNLKANIDKTNKKCIGATINSKELFLLKDTMWEIRFKVSKSLGGDWFVFLILPHKNDTYSYPLYDAVSLREITPIELKTKDGLYRSAGYFYDNATSHGENMDTEKTIAINDDFYNQWHVLKFCWDKNDYCCYMDDVLVYTVQKNDVLKNIPDDDFNGRIYIGADMMGECSGTIDVNMPEADYYVDYVKVWKKN